MDRKIRCFERGLTALLVAVILSAVGGLAFTALKAQGVITTTGHKQDQQTTEARASGAKGGDAQTQDTQTERKAEVGVRKPPPVRTITVRQARDGTSRDPDIEATEERPMPQREDEDHDD